MNKYLNKLLILGSIVFLLTSTLKLWAGDLQDRIQSATSILENKQHSDEPIPAELLENAKGVAIFTITKAGLGIGGQGGEGLVVVSLGNTPGHGWSAPSAFNLSGASLGAQIGFSETKYIVILNTEAAVEHFTTTGKVNMNANASGTAGDKSATANATTADLEHWEIVVYKDSTGVFGGATLGETSIERKDGINQELYGDVDFQKIINGTVTPPSSTDHLYQLLAGAPLDKANSVSVK